MAMEQWIRAIAGSFILISVILAVFISEWWLLFTLFVAINLIQSAFTRWCLMEKILGSFGVQSCCKK